MSYLRHLPGLLRMMRRAWHVRRHGFHQYVGNAEPICTQIVNDCWNGQYFQTSAGHFCEFWTRDFGMCTEALLKLGYKKEVTATLAYALARFAQAGKITTHITPRGKPLDFPYYAADSLPFLIHSLRLASARSLLEKHYDFLLRETSRYYSVVFDPKASLVHADTAFSSIKDFARRKSATYDNCMLAMLRDDLTALRLHNPFAAYDIAATIKRRLWNGRFFEEDLTRSGIVTGDANTFPFWCNVFNNKKMIKSCLARIHEHGLDQPFPLAYTTEPTSINDMILLHALTGGYEHNTIWMHLGLCYMDVAKRYDKQLFKVYVKQLTERIEQHKTFLEVYDKNGKPFHTLFYYCDEGMLWATKYLSFLR